jgi:pimeloyl-ACP methyl ester carboxylesterase
VYCRQGKGWQLGTYRCAGIEWHRAPAGGECYPDRRSDSVPDGFAFFTPCAFVLVNRSSRNDATVITEVKRLNSPLVEIVGYLPAVATKRKPLLFVHGYMQGPWVWERFVSYFTGKGYNCYTLKFNRHHGAYGKLKQRWKPISSYVKDLKHCVEAMKEEPIVIAHSMGGMVLQEYLKDHIVSAAVLLGALGPKGLGPATLRMAKMNPLVALKSNLLLDPTVMIGTPDLYRQIFFSNEFPEEEIQELHTHIEFDSALAYAEMLSFHPGTKTIENIRKHDIPLLVVGSREDVVVGEAEVRKTAEVYDAEMKLFEAIGHNMMLDNGWKGVASTIADWLDRVRLIETECITHANM